jgi:hypothetical protein
MSVLNDTVSRVRICLRAIPSLLLVQCSANVIHHSVALMKGEWWALALTIYNLK